MSTASPARMLATRPGPSPARRSQVGPSSILLKVALAISGLVMFGFVAVHMAGNLKVYLGAGALDAYGAWLREVGYPLLPHGGLLWAFRIALLLAVVLHTAAAAVLARRNRAAAGPRRQRGRSYTARTMPITGIAILLFIVFHVLDLTTGQANPAFVDGAVQANLVASLSRWPVALAYMAAMLLLGSHLVHGLWSAITTLGFLGSRTRAVSRAAAAGIAGVVVLANASIPLAIVTGLLT